MSNNIIEINVDDAYEDLKRLHNSYLIDVRTKSEWEIDGVPDTYKLINRLIKLTITLPGGIENEDFLNKINDLKLNSNDHLFFICRSGVRSITAANKVSTLGFKNLYNITGGFSFGWLDKDKPFIKN